MYDDVVVVKATAPYEHILARKTTHVTAENDVVLSENVESNVLIVTSETRGTSDLSVASSLRFL